MRNVDVDVVVVGAGLAGLTAAVELERAGARVAVVEARDRVGGRTCNHPVGEGEVVDMGAMWIARAQPRIARWIDELGIRTFPTWNEGRHVAILRGRRRTFGGSVPFMSPAVMVDVFQAQTRLDRMSKQLPVDAPWRTPRAQELDSMTFESWVRKNLLTELGRDFMRYFAHAIFATESSHFSLLHVLFYLKSSGGFESLISVEGGGQEIRIEGGTQAICLGLAELLRSQVWLECPAGRIEQGKDGVRVDTAKGGFRGRHAIVAVPPTLVGGIDFEPALPAERAQLVQRLPMGCVSRCMPVYERPFWREAELSGQAVSDEGPVKLVFDCSPRSGSPGVLLAFLLGEEARRQGALPLAERRSNVLRSLARYFGEQVLSPMDYVEKDWGSDPWARGGYGAHFPPGVWTGFGRKLREPTGRIHWAGAETALHYTGQMEGAVESGERCAREVLKAGGAAPGADDLRAAVA